MGCGILFQAFGAEHKKLLLVCFTLSFLYEYNNDNSIAFLQGNSISYFRLAAIKTSPVIMEIKVESHKNSKAYYSP